MQFTIKPISPFGVAIQLNNDATVHDIEPKIINELLTQHHLLLVRQSQVGAKENLVRFSKRLGDLLEWDFGHVMEMKPDPDAKNYLFTKEKVPFHWDGAFYQTPRFLVFNCIQAPDMDAKGETLFANTSMIIEDMDKDMLATMSDMKLLYQTEKLAHYGGTITESLVQTHPVTEQAILRFAEPVLDTMLNPVHVSVIGEPKEGSDIIINELRSYCYDSRYCYTHTWVNDDLLIADNHALLHARNAFSNDSERHLRRIQIL